MNSYLEERPLAPGIEIAHTEESGFNEFIQGMDDGKHEQ